jgi:hypothetical protein
MSTMLALSRLWRTLRRVFPSSHYVLLSLFFFVGLELIFAFHRLIITLPVILLFLVGIGIILIRTEERGRFHPTQAILPSVTAAGLTGFALFLPTEPWLHLYFVVCAFVLFFLLKHGAKQAYPTWNWVISLGVLFLNLATVLGWHFYMDTPLVVVLAAVLAILFLISLQSLQRVIPTLSETILVAVTIAFVLTEITWAIQFLPLHSLVQSGLLVALYYVIFHLTSLSYERRLTGRDIFEYVTVGSVALVFILVTAQWV